MRLSYPVVFLVSMVMLWYPVATENLPPVNEDNLDPDAAHVCKRTEKEAYTRRVSYRKYFTEKTNTWCFAVPPRCTEYRIASKTEFRIDTLYRDRIHYYCCEGYKANLGINYCVPICEEDCNADENQGYCVTPGNCKCNRGFGGTYCESGCASDRWGPNCTYSCNCGSTGSCDPYDGFCICHIGYTGADCSQPCINSFGLRCVHPCICENGATCDNVNGRCTCAPGFYGPYCQKVCDHSTTGEEGCETVCPCQNNGECDANVPELCHCLPGYKGQYCAEQCDRFHWGQNCSNICMCNFGECDPVTGKCSCEMGYAGDRCEVKCPEGFYGVGCLTKCGCHNGGKCYFDSNEQQIRCNCTDTGFHGDVCEVRDCEPGKYIHSYTTIGEPVCISCNCVWATTNSCHPLNGSCTCEKGYQGDMCTDKCKMPFYGDRCEEVCQCKHGDCHHVTGQCSQCYAGYLGVNCTQPCPEGTWGLQCAHECECMNNATCHAKTGYCECAAGFHGLRCKVICPPDKYGPNCTADCQCNPRKSECNPYTGMCHCKPGFSGSNCENACQPGLYGIHCRQRCDCDDQTSVCNPQTGTCQCKGGWFGEACQDRCHPLMWGPYCSQTCDCNGNGECDPEVGACQCYPGYSGMNCDRDSNGTPVVGMQTNKQAQDSSGIGKVPLMMAIIVPCIILLLILAAVVFYFTRKMRRMKDENSQVFFRNGGDTMVPNGGTSIGVVNPTYDDDNLRNESRYPHLNQRASVAPPLPHRMDSHGACADTDDVKLRVSIDKVRPPSNPYADVDDMEDRYTTLKSINGNVSRRSQRYDDDDSSCGSMTQNMRDKLGHVPYVTYAENENPVNHPDSPSSSSHQSLNSNHEDCPIKTENLNQDHPDACNDVSNQTVVKNKASNDHDVPPAENQTSEQIDSPDINAFNEYINYKQADKPSGPDSSPLGVKTKPENPYDIPHSGPVSDRSVHSTNTNHYQSPSNSGYMVPRNNTSTDKNENKDTVESTLDIVGNVQDFENVDPLESSLFDGSDRNNLLKGDNELQSNSLA